MRHLGVTITHHSMDRILIDQTMIQNSAEEKKLTEVQEVHQLGLTYDQAYDLKEQLIDFLGNYEPEN